MISKSAVLNKAYFWVSKEQVDDWFRQTNTFFILSHGRSGTAFLARLLNQADNAYVVHEPTRDDFPAYRRAYHNQQLAIAYFESFRKKEIFLRARSKKVPNYGEVNSLLRRHVPALRALIPQVSLIHLVRDGRDVVRSMWSRRTMTPADPHTSWLKPSLDDPYYTSWDDMDRFSRLCWYWQNENAYLRHRISDYVRFERLIQEYHYFETQILERISLFVSKSDWERAKNNPKNQTPKHQLPSWQNWDQRHRDTFLKICGEEMKASGYEDIERWNYQ